MNGHNANRLITANDMSNDKDKVRAKCGILAQDLETLHIFHNRYAMSCLLGFVGNNIYITCKLK